MDDFPPQSSPLPPLLAIHRPILAPQPEDLIPQRRLSDLKHPKSSITVITQIIFLILSYRNISWTRPSWPFEDAVYYWVLFSVSTGIYVFLAAAHGRLSRLRLYLSSW